jgi:transposase
MDVRDQKTPLRLLAAYGGPSRVEAESQAVATFLADASRGRLSTQAIEGVVAGARETLGVPMMDEQQRYVRALAVDADDARRRAAALDDEMKEVGQDDAAFARLASWMGTYTAAVLVTMCDPLQYENPRQLEKACGLNLREKSSGEHRGRLSITKRGPGVVRQVLYLFALRMIHDSVPVRAWYQRRRAYTADAKRSAIVALMRKLVRAAFHVARGSTFDPSKLFDLRRLDLESCAARSSQNRAPRTTPRPIARGAKRSRKEVNASA